MRKGKRDDRALFHLLYRCRDDRDATLNVRGYIAIDVLVMEVMTVTRPWRGQDIIESRDSAVLRGGGLKGEVEIDQNVRFELELGREAGYEVYVRRRYDR
ncbi:MAG: hypothetical protein AAGI37_04865 [Planctomycetota bacterium]